jgi:SNF2 family DNA or RNA helicase
MGQTTMWPEDQIEKLNVIISKDRFELIEQGRYGRSEDLRRSLTHVHLSGRLANLVYSMGVTNTDFYAHQYKPLLTMLESPADGLLIADEVGLGKTIEAGIIWTELRAREDMRRLLIVCPCGLAREMA